MRHLTLPQISASLDGELAGPSLELVQRHLAECELCRSDLARMAELDTLLVSAATYEPGEAFFDDLAARIEEGIGGRKRTPSRARPESVPARELPPVRLYPPAEAFGPGARIGGPEPGTVRAVEPARDIHATPSSPPLEIEREVVSAIESAMESATTPGPTSKHLRRSTSARSPIPSPRPPWPPPRSATSRARPSSSTRCSSRSAATSPRRARAGARRTSAGWPRNAAARAGSSRARAPSSCSASPCPRSRS